MPPTVAAPKEARRLTRAASHSAREVMGAGQLPESMMVNAMRPGRSGGQLARGLCVQLKKEERALVLATSTVQTGVRDVMWADVWWDDARPTTFVAKFRAGLAASLHQVHACLPK